MGASVWWVAVEGKPPRQVLEELGLQDGEPVLDTMDAPVTGVLLSTGWYLINLNREARIWYDDTAVAGLSKGCRVILFEGQETAMGTRITQYVDGQRTWHAEHDGDTSRPVAYEGDLPPEFHAINDEIMRNLEEDEDGPSQYEVSVRLGKALVGYEYYFARPDDAEVHELHAAFQGTVRAVPVGVAPPAAAPQAAPSAVAPPRDSRPAAPSSPPPRPWWKLW